MKLYKIFIPKFYNNGELIPIGRIRKITENIREKFSAYSFNPFARLPILGGVWTNKDSKIYSEPMQLIELFVEDTFNNQKWIKAFKEICRQELDQEEIFIIVQDAELIFQ